MNADPKLNKAAAKAAPGAGPPDYTGCNATPSNCNALHRHKELGPRQQELYEEVAAAVFSLTQRGIRPTNALIRESLGGGSMSTIAPVLHAVMADNAALNAEEGIDVKLRSDFVNGAAKQLLVMLYDMKVREADEKVGGVLSLCREANELAGIHIRELSEEIERLNRKIASLSKDLNESRSAAAGLAGDCMEKDREIASLKARIAEASSQKEIPGLLKEVLRRLDERKLKRAGASAKANGGSAK